MYVYSVYLFVKRQYTHYLHECYSIWPANCADGAVRLVGGSTIREGRAEVCMDGRWGTVCNNSQEGIAGAVCSQLGFPTQGKLLSV